MSATRRVTLKSAWLDQIQDLRGQLANDDRVSGDAHAIAFSILILAGTVERTNMLLQESINTSRIPSKRRHL